MIPSIYAWRPPLSMHILMGVQRIGRPSIILWIGKEEPSGGISHHYMLFSLAKWLGIHLTRVHGPSSDQSALIGAS